MKTILKKRTLFLFLAILFSCLRANAQEDSKHYLPPTFFPDLRQVFVHVVLTTNETTPFSVTYTYADGKTATVTGLSKTSPITIVLNAGDLYDGMVCITENRANQVLRTEGIMLASPAGQLFFVNEMFEVTSQADIVSSKGATAGLGTDFYSGHLSAATASTDIRSHFISVMASEDNTVVTFDNPRVKWQGQPTNTFSITLNKGESYIVAAPFDYISSTYPTKPTAFGDYNGTHITTNGKKIAVNCGSFTSSGVPNDGQDAGVDQIVPVEYTGKEYIAVEGNGVDNNGNGTPENEVVTIVGTANNTIVSVNGVVFATIQKGGYCVIPESKYQNRVMYISTTQNAYAYQTLSGSTEGCTSGLVFVPRLTDNAAKAVTISGANDVGDLSLYITTKMGSQVKINGNVVTSTPITVPGKPDWVAYRIMTDELNTYCTSGNNCADKGSNSTFSIQSNNAMNAAVSVINGVVGGAAYYSGFGMPNAKAGVWKLGITDYTLSCNSAVELLASGAIKYTWSGTPAAMALIAPKPSTNDSIQIFTPNSSAGSGPFVYNVAMLVTNPISGVQETQNATLTINVNPIESNLKDVTTCYGTPIGLNGTATPISTKTSYVTGVNMGGPTYVDSNGYSYSRGNSYNQGGQFVSIANTSDQTLYQSETWNNGAMNFKYTLPNGTYTVKLMWAETYFDQAGKRKFNVNVEGGQILKNNLDIFVEAGGKARAYNIEQSVTVTDGVLNVDLTKGSADNPMINALLITKQLAEVPSNGCYTWSPASNLNYTTVESPLFTPVNLGVTTYKLNYDDGHCAFQKDVKVTVTDCTSPCDVTASINGAATAHVVKGTDVNLASSSGFTFLEWRKIVGGTESVVSTTNLNPIVRADEAAIYRVSYIKPDNLVVNGDFSQGANVGFTVDPSYELISANSTAAHHDQWSVGNGVEWARPGSTFTNPTALVPNPDNVGGKILYMDGGWVPGVGIYQTTVPVVAGAKYVFSAYVANIYGGSKPGAVPPELRFQIDGTNLDYITGLTIAKQQWVKFYTTWTATTTGNISIKLLNNSTAVDGNDFAIDNIRFSPICTNDVTVTVQPPTFTVDAGADTDICDGQTFTRKATVNPLAQGKLLGWYKVNSNGSETLVDDTNEQLSIIPTTTTTYRVKYKNTSPVYFQDFENVITKPVTTDCFETNVPLEFNNDGNNGFTVKPDGVYMITKNPKLIGGIPWSEDMVDHSGSGNMMFVNGGSDATSVVYTTTVNIVKDHYYNLSAYAATPVPITDIFPRADLVFEIDGVPFLPGIDLSTPPKSLKTWYSFNSGSYKATKNGSITITIRNNQTAINGNDFALDDVTFAEIVTDDVTVTVNPKPGVNIGNDRSICEGESIGIENISQVDTYKWYKDGTKVSDDFKIKVGTGGTYRLDAVSSKSCTNSQSIIVTQVAKPIFTAIDGSACFENSIQLTSTAPSTTGFSYQWFARDDVYFQTPLETASSYTAPTNGDYILKVSVTASGLTCSSVDTATASYKLRPALIFNYAKKDLCLHDAAMTIKLSDSYNLVGTLTSHPANKGIKETSSGNYLFTPKDAVVGDNQLKFTWSDGTCSVDTIITLAVHDVAPPIVYANATANQVTTFTDKIGVTPYSYFHGTALNYENQITWIDNNKAILRTDQPEGDFYGTTTGLANNTQKYGVYQTDGTYGCKSDTVSLTYTFTVCDGTLNGTASYSLVCYGDKATVTLTASGGNAPYTYVFNGVSQDNGNFNNISSQVTAYDWSIKDKYGCEKTGQLVVSDPAQITATFSKTANIKCSGTPNGSATVLAGGGTGTTYSYSWNTTPTSQVSATASNLAAGTYNVEVTDSKSCKRSFSVAVADNLVYPSVTASISKSISCYGDLGEVTLSVGNNTSASYDFTFAATTKSAVSSQSSVFTSIAKGTGYGWKVKDLNNCEASGTIDVSEPTQIQATLSQTSNTKCSGTPNGTAKVVASGGTGATYTYSWNTTPTAQTTPTALNLAAGKYTVEVTDTKSCMRSFNVDVSDNLVNPSVTASVSKPILCYADLGEVTLAVSNNTSASYDFTLASTTNSAVASQSSVFTSIANGTGYAWKVKDLNNCEASGTIDVSAPSQIQATLSQTSNTICSGVSNGTATVLASGGTGTNYVYKWSTSPVQNTPKASQLSAGKYFVEVMDNNSCKRSFSVDVADNLVNPSATATVSTAITCFGGLGEVTLAVTNNTSTSYDFSLDSNTKSAITSQSIVFTGIKSGTGYIWKVVDLNNCEATGILNVSEPVQIQGLLTSTANTKCAGIPNGTATVVASGGTGATYTYSWNTSPTSQSTATATLLAAGTYTVEVTDSKSCKRSFDVGVANNLFNPIVTASVSTPISCNGGLGEVTLMVTNNTSTSYDFSLASNTKSAVSSQSSVFTGIKTGNGYSWSVKDLNSCEASGTIDVSEPTQIQGLVSATANTLCSGTPNGMAAITASGGTGPTYTYSWNTSPTSQKTASATQLAAGTYTVEVTDSKSCVQSFDVVVSDNSDKPIVTASVSKPISCFGGLGDITLAVTNNTSASYDFMLASNTRSGVASQSSVFTGVKSGNAYAWKVTDPKNCEATGTIDLAEPTQISATISSTPNKQCSGVPNGTATVAVSGGVTPYSYSWNTTSADNNSATTTELGIGNYQVTVLDANNCASNYSVSVSEDLVYPSASIVPPTILTCAEPSISLDGSSSSNGSNFSYEWSGPGIKSANNAHSVEVTLPGEYKLTVKNIGSNCFDEDVVTVTQATTPPAVFAGEDQEVCIYGAGANLEAQVISTNLISKFDWSPSSTLIGYNTLTPIATPSKSTTYVISVTDDNGCVGVDTVFVKVKPFEECYHIVIPPYFTPNEDGYNDNWVIEGLDQFPQSKIQVFDRYGQLVHLYLESDGDWNGYSYGKPLTSDDYWYVIDVIPVGVTLNGHVTIKR